jgi:hypothetical protein
MGREYRDSFPMILGKLKLLSSSSAPEMNAKAKAWEKPELEWVRTPFELLFAYIWTVGRVTYGCVACTCHAMPSHTLASLIRCLTDGRVTDAKGRLDGNMMNMSIDLRTIRTKNVSCKLIYSAIFFPISLRGNPANKQSETRTRTFSVRTSRGACAWCNHSTV